MNKISYLEVHLGTGAEKHRAFVMPRPDALTTPLKAKNNMRAAQLEDAA